MKGFDCYGTPSEDVIKEAVKQGFSFVPAYLMPDGYGKRLTKEGAQLLTDYGMKIANIFEDGADNALFGSEQGASDGLVSLEVLRDFGVPENMPVYFAVDFEPTDDDNSTKAEKLNLIEAYIRAAAEQVAPYLIGVYGSFEVVEEMIARGACKWAFQTYAWSRGQRSEYASIYQYSNGEYMLEKEVDYNEAKSLDGMWNYNVEVEEDEMLTQEIFDEMMDDWKQRNDPNYPDFASIPEDLKAEVKPLLEASFINGGTDIVENATDVNLTRATLKGVLIAKRYLDGLEAK